MQMADSDPDFFSHLEEDISIHIFAVSAAMSGVCLTVIGMLRVVFVINRIDSLADDLLAGNSILFLTSCLLSYFALRTRSKRRMHRLERIVDSIFILAMLLMVVACVIITFAIAVE